MVRTFLQIDSATVNDQVKAAIRSNYAGLSHVCGDVDIVQFDPTVFCHALLLLGHNPNRFRYDLSLYLSTVRIFFEKVSQDRFLVIGGGSVEFKKRISEDLGVALAALFMVTAFQLRWETIGQIPSNTKLSKWRPDFLGFNHSEDRFIFEAKGTTQPQKVEGSMDKALEQAKSYSDEAMGKYAIVSYFPSGGKQLPPFTFIADPPVADFFFPGSRNSTLLHYLKVLEYSGQQRTLAAYVELLGEVFTLERRRETTTRSAAFLPSLSWEVRDKLSAVNRAYASDDRKVYTWKDRVFVGQDLRVQQGERQLSVFLGVDKAYIERILKLETDLPTSREIVVEGELEIISILSDGTIFRVTPRESSR